MRTLRDFNVPKIVTDDVPVFMGLIGDLFPALDVPRKRDQEFEKMVKQAAIDLHLQPEENFVLKVIIIEFFKKFSHFDFFHGLLRLGCSTGRNSRGTSFRLHRWQCWYRKNSSMENAFQDISKHETKTNL